MKAVLFCHAFTSCWNNGHAHFLRGVAREMLALGHRMIVCEAADGWSRLNAIADAGADILEESERLVPGVELHAIGKGNIESRLDDVLDGAGVVLVHEWNEPSLIASIGRRRRHANFLLFFLDAHHRLVTAPETMAALELGSYDAVLAFGESLRERYARRGWGARAYTWHEAADTALFQPIPSVSKNCDLVWIGNWGDDERSRELQEFLIDPVGRLGVAAHVHGVRYPQHAISRLATAGIGYCGWLPNHRVPQEFAQARVTIHVPRQAYQHALPGIPTIRVFEALACGIPLVCSPWSDDERLFPSGAYLQASSGTAMVGALRALLADPAMASELARRGRESIEQAHTCRHRVEALLSIVQSLRRKPPADDIAPAVRDMEPAQ